MTVLACAGGPTQLPAIFGGGRVGNAGFLRRLGDQALGFRQRLGGVERGLGFGIIGGS